MQRLIKFLKHKEIRSIYADKNFQSDINNFYCNKIIENFNLCHLNNKLSKNISDCNENNFFKPILLSNKNKNYNPLDLSDYQELFYYINDLKISEKEGKNKAYIFYGDLENKKKSFCSGADLKYLYSLKFSQENYHLYFNIAYLSISLIKDFKAKNYINNIFIWNGVVMGGGLGLGIYSKIRIATDSTILAMPETKIGFFPNVTYANFISEFMSKEEAYFFGLLSHKLSGIEAYLFGFATHFILDKYVENLINEIKLIPYENQEEILEIIKRYQNISFKEINNSSESLKFNNRLYEKLREKLFINNFMEFFKSDYYKNSFLEKNIIKHKNKLKIDLDDSVIKNTIDDEFFRFDKNQFIDNYCLNYRRNENNKHKENLKIENIDFEYLEKYDLKNNILKEKNILLDVIYNYYLYNKFCRLVFSTNNQSIKKEAISLFNQKENSIKIFQNFYINIENNLLFNYNSQNNLTLKNLIFYSFNEIKSRSLLSLKQTNEITDKAYLDWDFERLYDLDMEKSKESNKNVEVFEGIRAFFVEKDNTPKWKYNSFRELENVKI